MIKILDTAKDPLYIKENKLEKVGRRNYLIFDMFLTYALRITELSDLKLTDIDFENKQMKLLRKGKKISLMPITDKTIELIRDYKELERSKTENDYIFLSLRGSHLSDRYIRQIVYFYTSKILDFKISPHKLRATCASYLISKDVPIYSVKEYLDHDSVVTTQMYAAHKVNAKREIVNIFEQNQKTN